MIVGNHDNPAAATEALEDLVIALPPVVIDKAGVVAKLSALLDGGGEGSGVQRMRGVMWGDDGSVKAVTDEIEIANGAPVGWYDFPVVDSSVWSADESRRLGLHFGGPSGVARWYNTGGEEAAMSSDAYADGTDVLTAPTTAASPLVIATYALNPSLPHEPDLYYARLGFPSAQEKLGETQGVAERHRMIAGWHGTSLDAEPQGSSLAIVDSTSPLADALLGERIRIHHHGRSVVAYVHRTTELDSGEIDLSLSRRTFAALGLLSTEQLNVKVEVLH